MGRLTDKKAIRLALFLAIELEDSVIESYRGNSKEEAVINAQRNIAAFQRVPRSLLSR